MPGLGSPSMTESLAERNPPRVKYNAGAEARRIDTDGLWDEYTPAGKVRVHVLIVGLDQANRDTMFPPGRFKIQTAADGGCGAPCKGVVARPSNRAPPKRTCTNGARCSVG